MTPMTTTATLAGLLERLREQVDSPTAPRYGGGCISSDGKAEMWLSDPVKVPRNPDGATAASAIETLLARIAALEEALEPFAEIARGEVYEKFASEARMTFRLTNGSGDRSLTFINAECFDLARATLKENDDGRKA